jgi:hypothetical protein
MEVTENSSTSLQRREDTATILPASMFSAG